MNVAAHPSVAYSLVAIRAHERYHAETVSDELIRKHGRVCFNFYHVDGWQPSVEAAFDGERARTDSRNICHHYPPQGIRKPGSARRSDGKLSLETTKATARQVDILQDKVHAILFQFTDADGGLEVFVALH